MKRINWDNVIDTIQVGLVWFVISVITCCTVVLILFDVLAGAGVMNYLTSGNLPVAFVISLATTGLLLALMFIGYSLVDVDSNASKAFGYTALLLSFGVFVVDVIFDSLTADVLRYSTIVSIKNIDMPNIHLMFRILIGGISTMGEPLSVAIIVGMPVIKVFINKAMPISRQFTQPMKVAKTYNKDLPLSIPRASSIVKPQPPMRTNPMSGVEPTYHPVSYQSKKSES